ncbi:hypothetical protein EJ08DRAFT_485315 [Tothia fuscella]|uniref:Uncharacterized protein n=1 Tax=Tothia fuscella TaxID=1048955 RepID=A0A9P4NI58_9PEZI|nr:hypothetical protein EJ08DRAFT_485315 [Tothia fuscella]
MRCPPRGVATNGYYHDAQDTFLAVNGRCGGGRISRFESIIESITILSGLYFNSSLLIISSSFFLILTTTYSCTFERIVNSVQFAVVDTFLAGLDEQYIRRLVCLDRISCIFLFHIGDSYIQHLSSGILSWGDRAER